MGNSIAYAVLFAWPVVSLAAFLTTRPHIAILITLVGGYLLLPVRVGVDLPMVPTLDKTALPNLSALALCLLVAGTAFRPFPKSLVITALLLLYAFTPAITVMTNRDPVAYGVVFLPGQTPYDAVSMILREAIIIAPFILGFCYFNKAEHHRAILIAFIVGAIAYTLPILVEVRLSPQLHNWIYGFFPHSFGQQVRFGGFRPVVFVGHGLLVAFFMTLAFLAALGMYRAVAKSSGIIFLGISAGIFVLLILCKTVSALIYAVLAGLMLLAFGKKALLRTAAVFAIIVLLFPVLRWLDVIPTHSMVELAQSFGEERAQSLEFRFDNEDRLLERAAERPLFGWGGYARNHLFHEEWGQQLTITDGTWIVFFGALGWFGYVARFGLLALPILYLVYSYRKSDKADIPFETVALCLILSVNLIDLLPNSPLTPLTWLMAGTLLGASTQKGVERAKVAPETAAQEPKRQRNVVIGGPATARESRIKV